MTLGIHGFIGLKYHETSVGGETFHFTQSQLNLQIWKLALMMGELVTRGQRL
jgi:hypothetical protein